MAQARPRTDAEGRSVAGGASSLDMAQRAAIAGFDGSMDERVQESVSEAWMAEDPSHSAEGDMHLEVEEVACRLAAEVTVPSLDRT